MTDVNDMQPEYAMDSYFALVGEDASVNDVVATAVCTDNDDGTTLSYRYIQKHDTF